jgi:hypothetical protein
LSACSDVVGDMQRDDTSVSSEETGKLVGRDTGVTKLSVLKENLATMRTESSSEAVHTGNVKGTRSSMFDATDKCEVVKNEVSGKWKNIRSKYTDGYQKHVVITFGVVICIFCCLRLIL